jgi:hypothetical protein
MDKRVHFVVALGQLFVFEADLLFSLEQPLLQFNTVFLLAI